MKAPAPFLLVLFSTASLPAAVLPAQSNISAVTVYPDRAVVSRTAHFVLAPGTHSLVFENLPMTLVDQSLQASGRGTSETTILDLAARQTFVDTSPNDRIRDLENQIRDLKEQTRQRDDRAAILGQENDFVKRMLVAATTQPAVGSGGAAAPLPSLDDWRQIQSYASDSLGQIATELQTLDREREDLAARQTALEQELAKLRGAGSRGVKTVTVRIDATSGGDLTVVLTYTVGNASWAPAYDARLNSESRLLTLSCFGVVRQNTGEDWNDVALTLSTARPSLGGAAPSLAAWLLGASEPKDLKDANPSNYFSRGRYVSPEEVESYDFGKGPNAAAFGGLAGVQSQQAKNSELAQAQFAAALTSATFRIVAPATVPSDNTTQKVSIASTRPDIALQYQATPKYRESAYLYATATNNADFPLLAGLLNSYLDGVFVGSSPLSTVMPGENFDLALGADDAIAVKRRVVDRFVEKVGLTNSRQRITYEFAVTVTNHRPAAAYVTLREPLPVSRDERIQVKLLTPQDREVESHQVQQGLLISREAEGGLAWKFQLQPGEKREVPLKFSVEYPADLEVTGLE